MMAIKAARAFTGKPKLAKFEGAYHGYYDYIQVSYSSSAPDWGPREEPRSLASSGGLAPSVLEDVVVLPYNDKAAAERILTKHKDQLAALIVDPLSNRMGFVPPRDGFLAYLRELTAALGIVLIFDEVISFRVAYDGAQGFYGVKPDLTAFGKIIGGGFPVGATGGSAEIMAVFDPSLGKLRVECGGTFSGNPVSMTAGLATMRQLVPASYERLAALGTRLRARANEVFAAHGYPGQATGEGSLFRLVPVTNELVDYRDVLPGAAGAAAWSKLFLALLDEGIIVNPNGLASISTPMGEAEIDAFGQALERAVQRVT
jgi:glutamate-1-semialdehyde 2,1-aminomutase